MQPEKVRKNLRYPDGRRSNDAVQIDRKQYEEAAFAARRQEAGTGEFSLKDPRTVIAALSTVLSGCISSIKNHFSEKND